MRLSIIVACLLVSVSAFARTPVERLVLILDYDITLTNEPLSRKIHAKVWAKSKAGWLYDHFCFDKDRNVVLEKVEQYALVGLEVYTNGVGAISVCDVSMAATDFIATPEKRDEWYAWMAARGIQKNQRRIWINETNTVGRLNALGYYLREE